MPDLPINVKWNPAEALAGMQRLEGAVGKFAGAAKGALAAVGIGFGLNALKDLYVGFEEDEAAASRLETTLKRLGATQESLASATAQVDRASREFGADDTELNKAMESLVVKTGDANESISNMQLVVDTAARFNVSYSESANVVAAAMEGQFRSLGALLPSFKAFAQENSNLSGTAEGASLALNKLWDATGGAAAEKANNALGQIQRMKTLWGEIWEQLVRVIVGSNDTAAAWRKVADAMENVLIALRSVEWKEWKGIPYPTIDRTKYEEQMSNVLAERAARDAGQTTLTGEALGAFKPSVGTVGGGEGVGGGAMAEGPYAAILNAPYQSPTLEPGGAGDAAVADLKRAWEEMDRVQEEFDKNRADAIDKYNEKIGTIATTLQEGFTIAYDNIGAGFKKMVEELRDYMLKRLITGAIGKIANMLAPGVGSMLGIFNPAGGGGGGFIDSVVGDSGGDMMGRAFVGANGSAAVASMRRMGRW